MTFNPDDPKEHVKARLQDQVMSAVHDLVEIVEAGEHKKLEKAVGVVVAEYIRYRKA